MKYPIKSVGIKHLDWLALILSTELPAYSKTLAMYLSRFMNHDQDVAWLSLKRIAYELSITDTTACKYLKILEDDGWLNRDPGNYLGRTTRYHVMFPKVVEDVFLPTPRHGVPTPAHGVAPTPPHGVPTPRHGVDLPHHTDTNKPLNKPVNKPQPNSNTSSPPASDLKRVPFQDIKSLYHKILPELPECKKLTPKRMGYIRARWADGLPDLEHWEKFFNAIRGSKFLMGQTEAGRGRAKPFRADLEWITNPTNYVKIFEGKYHE